MKRTTLFVFAASFAFYLYSSAPALAPYRDMGEMVSVSHTLGVAHPPGYPVYTLIGKIATQIPVSNQSYRLNLVSVAGGALACALFFMILIELGVSLPAVLLAWLLWLCSSGFWIISVVTEMYSLNVAGGLLLVFLCILWDKRPSAPLAVLLAFLGGFLSGVRMDLLLIGPAIAWLIFGKIRQNGKDLMLKYFSYCTAFFVLGGSAYLYLLIRSNQSPLLNWNRPETIERLWSSLARKTHGGTLDLLSQNYAPGELFSTDMVIYFKLFLEHTFWFGIPLAIAGLFWLWRRSKTLFVFSLIAWAFSGPFFIYKANMPPNPHALAILEAHFNLPNIFIYIWAGLGFGFLFEIIPAKNFRIAAASILLVFAGFAVKHRWSDTSKRRNFFGYDYSKNIFRTLPPQSILIMKKDVQLFLFWAQQYAEGLRPDVYVVAQGLAGSPWYVQMKQEAGFPVRLGPLRTGEEYAEFMRANDPHPIFIGWDYDAPTDPSFEQKPFGLVKALVPNSRKAKSSSPPDFLNELYVYRGRYNYESQSEFFSSDLIDDYSKAYYARGIDMPDSGKYWNVSIALHSDNPGAYYRRGFASFQRGDFDSAVRDYRWAESLYEDTIHKTKDYHSLSDIVTGIRSEWCQVLLNLGVAFEKLGRQDDSEKAYLKALSIEPKLAQAHYNIAVLYWNRDWSRVVSHLAEALRIDPRHALAAQYYSKAVYALEQSRKANSK